MYSDSETYQWKMTFEDGYILHNFDVNGNMIGYNNVVNYHNVVSKIKFASWVPFSDREAKIINNNKTHKFMAVPTSNPSVDVQCNGTDLPYIRKRVISDSNKLIRVYAIADVENSKDFIMVTVSGEKYITEDRHVHTLKGD